MSKIKAGLKKFYSCFLFGKSAEKYKAPFWIWNAFFILGSGIGLGTVSLLLAYGNYPHEMFSGYFRNEPIAFLNILPVVILVLTLYCLIGRAWIAFLAAAIPVLGMSLGNYYKLAFRDDPFIASDFSDIAIGIKFGGRYGLFLNKRIVISVALTVIAVLFLAFFVRGRIRARFRVPAAALLIILCIFPLRGVYTDNNLYNNKIANLDYPNANVWSSTQRYISRGFVYPFLHSIPDAIPKKPEGYSEEKAKEILSSYVKEDIPEDKKIDIIGIQLEAFNDFERLGIPDISESVYEKYRALAEESYTGRLVTNIFAGGTIDTERTFLTGFYELDDFRRDTGSYVRYFKDQGYAAEGGHPCYDWFYNRKNINRYLGFDDYWFFENRYGELHNSPTAPDDIFIKDLIKMYADRDRSKPYFNFSVTYQGHGPYPTDSLYYWGDGFWLGDISDGESYYILNDYLSLIKNTWDNIEILVDSLRDQDEPAILVLFGDHNPWLGNSNSVYNAMGVNLDTSTEEGFYNYYCTPYLIWANDAAKSALGREIRGEGPDVSPCYLMNIIFDLCGLGKGPEYMQLMSETMEVTPVLNTQGFFVENGAVTREPSQELKNAVNKVETAQYFRKRNPEW